MKPSIVWIEDCISVAILGSLYTWLLSTFLLSPWYFFFFFKHFAEKYNGHAGEGNGHPLVFLPGEPHGRGSLVGCLLWGRTESDTTEATQQQQQRYKWPGFPDSGPAYPSKFILWSSSHHLLCSFLEHQVLSCLITSAVPLVSCLFLFLSFMHKSCSKHACISFFMNTGTYFS